MQYSWSFTGREIAFQDKVWCFCVWVHKPGVKCLKTGVPEVFGVDVGTAEDTELAVQR